MTHDVAQFAGAFSRRREHRGNHGGHVFLGEPLDRRDDADDGDQIRARSSCR
jgi:hypothetical protein